MFRLPGVYAPIADYEGMNSHYVWDETRSISENICLMILEYFENVHLSEAEWQRIKSAVTSLCELMILQNRIISYELEYCGLYPMAFYVVCKKAYEDKEYVTLIHVDSNYNLVVQEL